MDSLDLQVLSKGRDWLRYGHCIWLVTVIETWGSAPRPPGALLFLRSDGQVISSVSGGSFEDDLIEHVSIGEGITKSSLMTYGAFKEEAAHFGPSWGLQVVGSGQLLRVLTQLALALDFKVLCFDSYAEYHLTWDVSGATFNKELPDDLVLQLKLDPHSAVVMLTHASKLDDMVLLETLKSPAFYTSALGSRSNTPVRKERLALLTCHRRKSIACMDRLDGALAGRRLPRLPRPSQQKL